MTMGTPNITSPFVAGLTVTGTALEYSTLPGGSGSDAAQAIDIDDNGNVYVAGNTASANFPTSSPLQPNFSGAMDLFIAKIRASSDLWVPTVISTTP